jgi:potassium uptake TrkH family protein
MPILNKFLHKLTDRMLFYLSIVAFLVLIVDWGFLEHPILEQVIYWFYWLFNLMVLGGLVVRIFFLRQLKNLRRQRIAQYILLGLTFLVFITELFAPAWIASADGNAGKHLVIYLVVILLFLEEVSDRLFVANMFTVHPSLIFAGSFVLLIFFGAALLMLPKSTTKGIEFIDALFTATSAVSVTGLAVLDTNADFTRTGQVIILILIQLGGLGMLTFTNLFGLLFRGGTSFQNQLFIKDTLNAAHLSDAFKTLIQIVVFTFAIEGIGAMIIFSTLDPTQFDDVGEAVFFSIFHAISAFCNAGFSTMTNSLYEEPIRANYPLHTIVAVLIIAGGIGYSIMINYYYYAKDYARYLFKRFLLGDEKIKRAYRPLVTLNTRLAILATGWLLLLGMIGFLVFEYNGVMKDMSWQGVLSNTFFGSVTPRTAGFNTVNMADLSHPTIMLYLLLMWIGASPGSTGGGIKTTTFTVAFLNGIHQLMGRDRMEVGWKEIPAHSVQRAFAILFLSVALIGFAATLISWFEPKDLDFRSIVFESVSAYSTVGLSLGITAGLGTSSKLVLILTMFLGRVGTFTLLMGIVRTLTKRKMTHHRYPKEDVFM